MQTTDNDGRPIQDGSPEPTQDSTSSQYIDVRVPQVPTFDEIDAAPRPVHVPITVPGDELEGVEQSPAEQGQAPEAPATGREQASEKPAPEQGQAPEEHTVAQGQAPEEPAVAQGQAPDTSDPVQEQAPVAPAPVQGQQTQQELQAQQEKREQEQQAALMLSRWIALSPKLRSPEAQSFRHSEFELGPQVNEDGTLTHAFKVGGCYFLLWYSAGFPRWQRNGSLPVRVYFVAPKLTEYRPQSNRTPFSLYRDHTGQIFVSDRQFEHAFRRLLNHRGAVPMAEAAIDLATRWVRYAMPAAQQQASGGNAQKGWRGNVQQPARQKGMNLPATGRAQGSMRLERPTFLDGRSSLGLEAPRECHKIVFSDRAFAQIYTETQARIQTETGGLLLGHYDHGTWYVIETCDPGWRGVFEVAYHEGDGEYENHVAAIMARLYKHPLVFLGMWHRHPGSLDTFSGTDDVTNWGYVDSCSARGCISGLINYDPEFRMTFYYCEQQQGPSMRYTRVDVEVGDDKFERPELLAMASKQDVDQRSWR